jgi:hypothetical protein
MKRTTYKIITLGKIKLHLDKKAKALDISEKDSIIINKIWNSSLLEKRGLFNNSILNFTKLTTNKDNINLWGNFVEYKQFLASRKRPGLNIKIKPIGISGMMIIKDDGIYYTVVAKRGNGVTDYNNFFELVPSGSIDRECILANGDIDYKSKILSELSEETNLPKNYAKKVSEFAIVLDITQNIYDICCLIFIDKDRATISKYFSKSKEYKNFKFIPLKNIDDFIEKHANPIVPTTIALIRAYKKFISKKG